MTPDRVRLERKGHNGDVPPLRDLTLSLLYTDDGTDIWTCGQLSRGQGVVRVEDLTPAAFYEVRGGLRAATGRIFTFLWTLDGHDLVSYVHFLLASVLHDRPAAPELERFRSAEHSPGVIATVWHQDGGLLRLTEGTNGEWALAFLNAQGRAPESQDSPFFSRLSISSEAWRSAALTALREYRQTLDFLFGRDWTTQDGFAERLAHALACLD